MILVSENPKNNEQPVGLLKIELLFISLINEGVRRQNLLDNWGLSLRDT